MVQHPAVRQRGPAHAGLARDRVPLPQRLQQRRLAVHAAVYLADLVVGGPAPLALAGDERGVLDEEAAGEGRVGVESDVEPAEQREQVGFDVAGDGVVVALVDGGQRVGLPLADVVDPLHVGGREVGDAELGRKVLVGDGSTARAWGIGPYVAEFSCFVDHVDGLKGLFDWGCYIWRVEIVDLDLH